MVILKFFVNLFVILASVNTLAEEKIKFCDSSKNFIGTVEYLKKQNNFAISGVDVVKTALAVSENCNDASFKFIKMISTLVGTGVFYDHALKFSIKYSKESTESVDAFLSLYEGLVLEKKFNLPFYQAFETARAFAESSKGFNKGQLKKDFVGFLDFCVGEKNGAQLSIDTCRQLSFKYLKLHALYEKGVFSDFKELFTYLRDSKETGLPIATALEVTQKVLENGPGSKKNFMLAYSYSLKDLTYSPTDAMRIAHKMAVLSKPKDEMKAKSDQ